MNIKIKLLFQVSQRPGLGVWRVAAHSALIILLSTDCNNEILGRLGGQTDGIGLKIYRKIVLPTSDYYAVKFKDDDLLKNYNLARRFLTNHL